MLSDQVSNLDSSEPKSDVLPVTPSDNLSFQSIAAVIRCANVARLFKLAKLFSEIISGKVGLKPF